MSVPIHHARRLVTLWTAWLLATLFHLDLGLMQVLQGRSPGIHGHAPEAQPPHLTGALLAYVLLPLIAILLISFADTAAGPSAGSRSWRRVHFWFSVTYSVTNVAHLVADILVPDPRLDQIVLMVVLTLLGLLISWEAWRWWRQTA